MGEYGKIDAEDGNPPSKIGRGNEEYMAAYNAVLQARGEEPLDIQQPDQAYLDALRSGQLEERSADDDRDLEEPVKYGSGAELEWDAKAQKYYDRKRDMYIDDKEEEDNLTKEGDENFSAKTEGKNPEMNLQSLAKGKAMSLLQTAKAMAQAPSHEPARGYAAAVSKDAGEIVDLMVELESFQAGTYVGASPTRESNEPFDMDAHMAAYESEPETIEYRKQIKQLVQMVADKKGIPVEQAAEEIASYVVTAGGLREAIGAMNVGQKTRYGVKGSGYGDGKKPSPAPAGKKLSGTQKALAFIKDRFGKDAKELGIDTFELTMHIGRPKTDEELKTKVIDFIQKNNIKIKEGSERTALKFAIQRRIETGRELAKELYANGQDESAQEVLNDVEAEEKRYAYLDSPASELDAPVQEGAGDKEARIRDVVKMGSWDNIDGVALSLPQAELLVAAMDNLSPANKEKLMAMPINKMLDIVNKMVDAGVITVNYGRAGLKEYGDHDAQASGGLVHSTHSSDPELDQIADIAADKKDWGLLSISKALKEQGFDTSLSGDVLVVDGKYFIGKEEKFDIGPDEEIRRIEGTSLVVGYMG